MSKTKQEIRDRAAGDLGILQLNQQLAAQDDARVSAAYDEIYDDLKFNGIATWSSTASVPDRFVPHLAALIAESCLSSYSVSQERFIRIKTASSTARREIKKLSKPTFQSTDDPQDF